MREPGRMALRWSTGVALGLAGIASAAGLPARASAGTEIVDAGSIGETPNDTSALNAASQAAERSLFNQLASVIVDEASFIQRSEASLGAIIQQFGADPSFAEMEAAYPGLTGAIADAIAPVVRSEAAIILPLYREDLAQLYASNISPQDAASTHAMLASPAMDRFRKALRDANSIKATARDIVGGRDVSSESIRSDLNMAALQASLQMDSADIKVIKDFYASPAGQKFAALNAQKLEIDSKWSNYVSPGGQGQISKLMIETMSDHVSRTDPKMGKLLRKELSKELKGT